MDLTNSIEPNSAQQNFDDYTTGPRTVTITEVVAGSSEQPVEICLAEYPGRPYKPSKSMRRVLVAAWGPQASEYVGRRMTLVGDPTVKFGGATVGGIKIAALSHIDKRLDLMLTASKGKRQAHKVEPLVESAPTPSEPTAEQVAACVDLDELRAMHRASGPERRAQIMARVAEIGAIETPAIEASVDTATGEIVEPVNSQWDEPTI